MTDLAGRARAVTPAPPNNDNFDPRAWLATFKEAGGWWCLIGDKAHLGNPLPRQHEPLAMLNELTPAHRSAVCEALGAEYEQGA